MGGAPLTLGSSDFTVFGPAPQFPQDRAAIDARWIELQRESHPDRFAAQGRRRSDRPWCGECASTTPGLSLGIERPWLSVACTTCHVIVREGFDSLKELDENEEDLLDRAWGLEPQSRLSCQVILAQQDVVLEIPGYTINHAKELH